MTPYEEQKKKIQENTGANMFARDSYSSQITPMGKDTTYRGFNDPQAFNPDLDTPQGLFNLANKAGFGDKADKMIKQSGGESQEFFSGGLLMDAMDVLNIGSYGIVGMMKGKGFKEGVKNRETFSDEDSLGQYGWKGKVAGFILDIAVDPLTYVAPWKIVTKIPGVVKNLDRAKTALVGELTTIDIGGQKLFHREGGYELIKLLPTKLSYGFAVDRKYLEGMQSIIGKNEARAGEVDKMVGLFAKTDVDLMKKTVTEGADGVLRSTPLAELNRTLSPEDMAKAKELYTARDSLMDRLQELGVISNQTKEEHWGSYLKQTYEEYVQSSAGLGGGIGVKSQRRVEGLTPEKMAELGKIKDPGVVWGHTLLKQIDLVKKAELQQFVAKNFSMHADDISEYIAKGGKKEDLFQISDSSSFKLKGKEADLTKSLATLNTGLKKIRKQRKVAIKDDKNLASTLDSIDTEMARLKTLSGKELGEGISGLKRQLKESGLYEGPAKKKPTSVGQKKVANSITKFLNQGSKSDRLLLQTLSSKELLERFLKTTDSISLEKAFEDPKMMYQWSSPSEFFDAVRYPDKARIAAEGSDEVVELSEAAQLKKIKDAETNTRKFGKLEQEKLVLEGTNKKLISDMVNKLEDEYADSLFAKTQILDRLDDVQMGQLAGRVVPKELWATLKQTFEPTREVGESIILPFKHAKVIWNPASYARNALSATIQNWWELGIGPWRADLYIDAAKEFRNGGGKVLKEMQSMGFNERSGQIQELTDNILRSQEVQKSVLKQFGDKSKIFQALKKADAWGVNAYGHTDNIAKVAAYKYGVKNGLSKQEALRKAYAATFNYSEVTPLVHSMRRAIWGVPFITFSLKAAPLVGRTLRDSPNRISVFGKARNDLFAAAGIEGDQEAEAMPDYMRDDMFTMRLPWKDGKDRPMYFDMSYIIPFGAIIDGSYAKDPLAANPVLQTVRELSRNKTFSGSQIFKQSDDIDQVTADIFVHIGKSYLPPLMVNQLPDGYDREGKRRFNGPSVFNINNDTDDAGPNQRTMYQEIFKAMGAAVQPYDLESKERQLAYKQKENLTNLLVENGVMKEFRNPYLPKDSDLKEPTNLFDSRVQQDTSR